MNKLIDKYSDALDAFRKECERGVIINSQGLQIDWLSLGVGFMLARGIPLSDAVALAKIVDSQYKYWL